MIRLQGITKEYQEKVLSNIDLELPSTGMYLIVGPSGCGKTTLLHILGGIDCSYKGQIFIYNQVVNKEEPFPLEVGYVFQQFHLLEFFNARGNIALPRYFSKCNSKNIPLDFNTSLKVYQLSGGQKQKVAISRANQLDIDVLLCDEPTGSLDNYNSKIIYDELKELSKEMLVVIVSHDTAGFIELFDGIITLKDGKVIREKFFDRNQRESSKRVKKTKKATIYYACKQVLSNFKRNSKVVFGVQLAMLFILFSFTFCVAIEKQVVHELNKLFPSQAIAIEKKDNTYFDSDEVEMFQEISDYLYVESSLYYSIGLSVNSTYNEEEIYFISDMTKSIDDGDIAFGRNINSENEVVLSKVFASKLFPNIPYEQIIGKTVYSYYQMDNRLESVEKQIIGISAVESIFDTLYVKELNNIYDIETLFDTKVSEFSFLMIETDALEIEQLRQEHTQYEFKETGKDTTYIVENIMQQVRLGLLFFSVLIIISSCFLVGQVIYLSTLQRKKELAICRCYGASKRQIKLLVIFESLVLFHISYFLCILSYFLTILTLNRFVEDKFSIVNFLNGDNTLLLVVYVVAVFLSVVSSLIPACVASKKDIVEGLNAK